MTRPSHTARILELLRAGRSPAVIAAELGVTPGHVVEVTRPDGTKCDAFEFDHPDVEFRGGDASAWAIALAKDVIASRWPECVDTIDWSTADVSKAGDC